MIVLLCSIALNIILAMLLLFAYNELKIINNRCKILSNVLYNRIVADIQVDGAQIDITQKKFGKSFILDGAK